MPFHFIRKSALLNIVLSAWLQGVAAPGMVNDSTTFTVTNNIVLRHSADSTLRCMRSYFPELDHVNIHLRIKKTFSPLATRPSWGNLFRARRNRVYIITISSKSNAALAPILFHHLSDSAKRGVIGHELSHVLDFHRMSWGKLFITALGHFSPNFLDRFEYRTDSICIAHGAGNELLAWSVFVREHLHIANWRGANYIHTNVQNKERYMNPGTIERMLQVNQKVYRSTL